MDPLLVLVPAAVDPVPQPEDVRAGWLALWIFLALIAVTGLLLWSFVRQLRKTRRNAERGVFDESPPSIRPPAPPVVDDPAPPRRSTVHPPVADDDAGRRAT